MVEVVEQSQGSVVACGARVASCLCVLDAGHDGLHVCDEGCGGSWGYDDDGRFVVGSFPSGVGIPRGER